MSTASTLTRGKGQVDEALHAPWALGLKRSKDIESQHHDWVARAREIISYSVFHTGVHGILPILRLSSLDAKTVQKRVARSENPI